MLRRSGERFSGRRLPTYYIYILANRNNKVLYTGITNDLERRLSEHKNGLTGGFTQRYRVYKLVCYDSTTDVNAAIRREKQIKGWTRAKKNALVEMVNPQWRDLTEEWKEDSSAKNASE